MHSVELRDKVLEWLAQHAAEQVTVIDVREKSILCDWMIVATGRSTRHTSILGRKILSYSKAFDLGWQPRIEGEDDGVWVLLDLGDVVLHLMHEEARTYYKLEKIWVVDTTEREDEKKQTILSD